MKNLFTLLSLLFYLQVSAQRPQEVPFRTIRTLTADLNNDGKIDTIKLISSLKDWNSFNKISISLTGYSKQVFKARHYWTVVDPEFLLKNKNDLHTKLLFLKKTDKHCVLLLFGELDGAGYRDDFSIINIENNHIKMPFDASIGDKDKLDVEIPKELTDLENNGRLCFVYTGIHELDGSSTKALNDKGIPDIGAYVPYLVYAVADTCKLDKVLSKEYMDKHYVFAGFKYSERIHILYPRNGGKPRIWKKPYFR